MKDSGCEAAQKETMLTGIHHWNCVDNHPAKLSGKPSENQSENKCSRVVKEITGKRKVRGMDIAHWLTKIKQECCNKQT